MAREIDFRPSIIITSFNHRDYLIEAVESVLAQSLPAHEIILADDCSSDGSQAVIESYRRRFPDTVKAVLQEKNSGIPRNRNSALQLVTGSHVGILDGDDYFSRDKLERQFEALRHNPEAGAVYGNFRLVDAERNPLRLKWNDPMPFGDIFTPVAGMVTGILRTLIVRYDLVREVGFMDTDLPMYDGLWLTIQLAAKCSFAYVDEVLVFKRDHPSSDSKIGGGDRNAADLRLIQEKLQPLMKDRMPAAKVREINERWDQLIEKHASTSGRRPRA